MRIILSQESKRTEKVRNQFVYCVHTCSQSIDWRASKRDFARCNELENTCFPYSSFREVIRGEIGFIIASQVQITLGQRMISFPRNCMVVFVDKSFSGAWISVYVLRLDWINQIWKSRFSSCIFLGLLVRNNSHKFIILFKVWNKKSTDFIIDLLKVKYSSTWDEC